MSDENFRVAVVGAGPAGIYAADILTRRSPGVEVDLLERLPAPYGLVRYGVAPDHPRIKQIIETLHRILQKEQLHFYGNVELGHNLDLSTLKQYYQAVILATGADRDRRLDIPGINLPQCYGAADFVSWYDGHPDYPRYWNLNHREVAVIGAGNVALDISRMLVRGYEELIRTEIPANVADEIYANPTKTVHVFSRRGPAQVKFTPLELRELGLVKDVDIIVDEQELILTNDDKEKVQSSNINRQVVKQLIQYATNDPQTLTAPRRIYLHLYQRPVEVKANDDGNVQSIVTEVMRPIGQDQVEPTGTYKEWKVQAVYRAVGYLSSRIPQVGFDDSQGIIPNLGGRVLQVSDAFASVTNTQTLKTKVSHNKEQDYLPGVYVTGWIKRGPVGLIGSTKSDAQETIANLLADRAAGKLATPSKTGSITDLLEERGIAYTTDLGWEKLDQFERKLAEGFSDPKQPTAENQIPRNRIKVVSRQAMTSIAQGKETVPDLIGTPGELDFPCATEKFTDYTGPKKY